MVMEDLTKGEQEVEQSLNKSKGQSAAFSEGERIQASRQLGREVRVRESESEFYCHCQ